MEFIKIVYPSPLTSYNVLDPDLIWIPKTRTESTLDKLLQKLRLKKKKEEEEEE